MCRSAKDVSLYVIDWGHKHHSEITNLRLQKLLYFIQGENIRANNPRLIEDNFYAWKLGPVIPSVYEEYRIYSSFVIPHFVVKELPVFGERDQEVIEYTLEAYSQYSTWDLVNLTHSQAPWKYSYEIFGNSALIPYESIERYFKGVV